MTNQQKPKAVIDVAWIESRITQLSKSNTEIQDLIVTQTKQMQANLGAIALLSEQMETIRGDK